MKSPVVWMNRTTSFNWNRPVVGIVRVETEVSEQLRNLYPDGVFKECIWDGSKFIEYKNQPKPSGSRSEVTTGNSIRRYMFQVVPKRQALINIAQGVFSLVPSSLRPFVDTFLSKLKPKVIKLICWIAARKQAKILSACQSKENNTPIVSDLYDDESMAIFSRGDVLVSMGLDWDHSFYKKFYHLRVNKGVKVITCCYDLIPVLYPQYCVANVAGLFSSYFIELADGSDEILCISKQSQKDLNALLDDTGGRLVNTSVFELGDNVPAVSESISDDVGSILNKKYILFVSSIERRKNHEVIYRAYHLLCKAGKRDELPLVVFVGMHGWGVNDLLKDIELDPLTKGKIVQLNHVNDSELRRLYESAMFCVFPSLYEGWGLPVGESLSLGKPVISSNRGSLPEVAGDLAVYLDPWSPDAWASEIYKMATDEEYRHAISERIKSEYKKRTWENAGAQVKQVVDKYLHSH